MREPAAYPYETRLNILYPALEVVDIQPLIDACQFQWYNQTLCKVNDSVVRLGVVQGELERGHPRELSAVRCDDPFAQRRQMIVRLPPGGAGRADTADDDLSELLTMNL